MADFREIGMCDRPIDILVKWESFGIISDLHFRRSLVGKSVVLCFLWSIGTRSFIAFNTSKFSWIKFSLFIKKLLNTSARTTTRLIWTTTLDHEHFLIPYSINNRYELPRVTCCISSYILCTWISIIVILRTPPSSEGIVQIVTKEWNLAHMFSINSWSKSLTETRLKSHVTDDVSIFFVKIFFIKTQGIIYRWKGNLMLFKLL